MGTTTPYNGKCIIVLWRTVRMGKKSLDWSGCAQCAAAMVDGKGDTTACDDGLMRC